MTQTKKQMDRSNRLACRYSIIRVADIHQFLSLSILRQAKVRVGDNHVIYTILRKDITIKVGLIEQARWTYRTPPFQQRVQVEFHLSNGPGGQNRAIYTTFGYVIAKTSNRPGGTLILAAKTTQQVEIEQVR